MKTGFVFFLTAVAALVSINTASACTTFNLLSGDVNIFGRNYDWSVGDGTVIVNKRGLLKTAMKAKDETGNPATWKSKYGSITFNQYGREFPQGGINEAGLVVEIMAVPGGEYPAPDSRPYVGKAQFRQYLLDSFSTVKEVIESDAAIRVTATGKGPMTHLLVSDRTGASAVIEFIGGKRVVYTGDSMPVRALSNTLYADSLSYWKAKKIPTVDQLMSVTRFTRAADSASAFDAKGVKAPVDHAFGLLKQVTQGDKTKWSIVYDIKNLQVFFQTSSNPKTRSIDLKKADFSCKTPVRTIDIDAGSGEISDRFQDYTVQANRKLIADAFGKTDFLKNIPAKTIDAIAAYPDSARCE
jgi:choloylglycine hydrolase